MRTKRKNCRIVIIFLVVGLMSACTSTNNSTEVKAIEEAPAFKHATIEAKLPAKDDIRQAVQLLNQYNDTANVAWIDLTKADSARIADIDKMVIQMTNSRGLVSKEDITSLKQLLEEAKGNRLSVASQFNNASLQHYYVVTDSLTMHTLRINSRLKLEHKLKPSMHKLAQSISRAENELLQKKAVYNAAARKYNDFFWEKRSCMLQAKHVLPPKPIRACFGNAS
ncbi:MAG TPA: hypothetical protein VNB90_11615 [Cytophagaceae bacterium]|nr:hypothetical protein [Cytophagaceae bacterium]